MVDKKKAGRPKAELDLDEVDKLLALGVPKTRIAENFGVSRMTLHTRLEEREDVEDN